MNEQRNHSLRRRWLFGSAVLSALVMLTACGGDSDAPTVPAPPPAPAPTPAPTPAPAPTPIPSLPDDPAAVILEVWVHVGPEVMPEFQFGRPPQYWLTAGGDLYAEGPTLEIWPTRLLPNLLATVLDQADLAGVLEDIAASTLPEVDDLTITEPTGLLADAPLTEFRFNDAAGETHVIWVEGFYAGEHRDPRVASLKALVDKLETAAAVAGAYRGDRVQVIVGFDIPLPQPEDQDDQQWPLQDPPVRTDDGAWPCLVFDGATGTRLLELFGNAHIATRWVWEEERIFLFARELFPGEEGCRELQE